MKNTKLQNPSLRKRKGFTLIELIVVIAILAILAAIAIPTFLGQLERARKATHNANVMTLRSSAAVAIAENGKPTANVSWTSAADVETDTRFNSAGYVDTWPTVPTGITGITYPATYTVTIAAADGAIAVTPAKVS